MADNSDIKLTLGLDTDGFNLSVSKLNATINQLEKNLGRVGPAVQRTETSIRSSTRSFRDLVMVAGTLRFALLSVYDVFGRLPMHIMRNAGELERMQALMKGLSKETEDMARAAEGVRDFNFVTDMAKKAPFEITALSDSFVKLKVAGIDPTNGSLQTLVDSVARFGGSSDVLKRASVAISQMAGKGVVSMEELRQQLGEAVPTAMKAMADGLGLSMSKLAKLVSTGTVQAMPAIEAMMRQLKLENDGAAAEMMNTWVGMNAKLKTEWMLTSKAIADSGFGEGMKSVVGDLTKMLQDEGFQNWARSFGAGLGEIINGFRSLAGFVREHAEIIKIAALAWAAYKVQTALVGGLADGLKKKFVGMREEIQKQSGILKGQSEAATASVRAQAAAYAADTAAFKRQSGEKIRELRLQNATINQLQQQRLAEYTRVTSQIAAHDRKVVELQNKIYDGTASKQQARQIGKYAAMAKEMDAMRLSANALSAEIGRQNNVMNSNERTVTALNGAIKRQEAAVRATAAAFTMKERAIVAATAACRGFNVVVGAMGGYVGLAITAITLLVGWYVKLKGAADDAAEAAVRAVTKTTLAGDVQKLNDNIDSRKKEIGDLQSNVSHQVPMGLGGATMDVLKSKKQADADKAAAEEKIKELDDLIKKRDMAQANLDSNKLDLSVQFMTRQQENAIVAISKQTDAAIKANTIEKEKLIKAAGKDANSDEIAKKLKELTDRSYEIKADGYKQQAEHWQKIESDLTQKALSATGEEKTQLEAQINEAYRLRQQAVTDAEQFSKQIDLVLNKDPKKDPATKGKKTPFGNLSDRLKGDVAQLQQQLEIAQDTGTKVMLAEAAIARMQAAFDRGAYKKEGVKQADIDRAAADMRMVASLKVQIKQVEEAADQAQKVSDFMEGMMPKYKQALMTMADPLGASGINRSNLDSVIADLQKHAIGYEAIAKKMGMTFLELEALVKGRAATTDLAESYRDLAQQTSTLQGKMTNTTRAETAKRLQIEFDAETRRQQLVIDTARAAGVHELEVRTMQGEMAENMVARQRAMLEETRHPLEKLASDWDNLTDNLTNATVGWTQTLADGFVEMATTGKASFKDMANSILKDLARMYAQKGFAQLLQMGIGAFMGAGNAGGGMTAAPASGGHNIGSFDYSFGGGGGLGLSATKFADGGIMTEFGSLPLRKYANGGIARSPQVAIYGEGKHAEAYVPLPDGRTIPVTMEGGGGATMVSNITINIDGQGNTQSSGGVSAGAGLGESFAKMLGTQVKVMVREEMLKQYRQGGVMA